jgi:hypothetical protein
MVRDLDLVLIPWVEDADHIDKVIDDIRTFVEGKYNVNARKRAEKKRGVNGFKGLAQYSVEEKPHGRKAITIWVGYGKYHLDISIMPRVEKPSNLVEGESK